MRPDSEFGRAVVHSKVGLMVLKEHFEQRPIGPTTGSFRSHVPLDFPSGPQETESELESELLQQLAFAPFVYDLMTQPIILYRLNGRLRRYTADIVLQLYATGDDLPMRYLIEVKRAEELARKAEELAPAFEAGRLCADLIGGAFRVMDETLIRTPYLASARSFSRFLQTDLTSSEIDGERLLKERLPQTIGSALDLMEQNGFQTPDARHIVSVLIAQRQIHCDLSQRVTDETVLSNHPNGIQAAVRKDPLLVALHNASDGVNK